MNHWYHVRNNIYIVRTQAGFRQALKDFGWEKECNESPRGFPRVYPSMVVMSWGYEGYNYVHCTCFPLNELSKIFNMYNKF